MTTLGLAAIGHVALKVADIRRSLEFYRDRLGFTEMMRLNNEDGSLWLVYLRISDTQFLELFPGGEGGSRARKRRDGAQPLLPGVRGFGRHSFRTTRPRHSAHCGTQDGPGRQSQCWIEDPDGNRIEFMQMSPASMQADAIRRLRGAIPGSCAGAGIRRLSGLLR